LNITPPPLQSIIADSTGKLPSAFPAWATFFQKLHMLVNASCQSGATANRPTQGLYAGRPYFDTSLAAGEGKPIWRNADNDAWVDATGTPV